jgi:hypothetical protein
MTDGPVIDLPAIDGPPRDGVYRDAHVRAFGKLTDDELAEGNRLGQAIDVDDDTDNGL